MIAKTFSEALECILTEDEIKQMSEENNKRVLERVEVKARAKKIADSFTLKIKTLDSEIETTAEILDEGKETRPVECEWIPDRTTIEMRAVRIDTFETIRRRAMDGDERREYLQHKLWETDSTAPAPAETEKEEEDDLTNEELQAILAMVTYEIPIETIETWTEEQRKQAREWAVAAHVHANDHEDVDVPPMPEFLKVDDWETEELKAAIEYEDQAVREAKTFGEIMADEDDGGGTPFPTEFSQAEINRMAEFYCADKIAKEDPVKICYVLDQPHVITSVGGGVDATSVTACSILPLGNVTEEGAAELREKSDFYLGKNINCGSKKNPDIWVIVGEEKTFTVDHSADYPDNEIEAKDDFTAERCDECGRIDGAHDSTCSKSETLTYDRYFAYAEANQLKHPASWARKAEVTAGRDRDAKVREWLKERAPKGREATAKG